MTLGLPYFGGKLSHLPHIVPLIDNTPHTHYLEPFFGGGSVFFNRHPVKAETINDLDGEIVNVFKTMREDPVALAGAVYFTPFSRVEYKESCDRTPEDNAVERARKTLHTIVSSVIRHQTATPKNWSRLIGALPNGGHTKIYQWIALPNKILAVAERLKRVQIENTDAIELIERFDEDGVLMYLDPPYAPETRTAKKLYRHEMNTDQHQALLDVLCGLKRAKFILSGYNSPLYEAALSDFERVDYGKKVLGIGTTSSTKRTECLWFNFQQRQKGLFDG